MRNRPPINALAIAGVACSAALLLSACDASNGDANSEAAPREVATSEAQAGDDRGTVPTVEPRTFTYANGPFPVTYTITTAAYDGSGGDFRILYGDPYGSLDFNFPVNVADLSQLVTAEATADEQSLLFAGPIDFPTDIGAWLDGAAALEIVDQGTLSIADGDASWWDVEVSDPSAKCLADPPTDEPCVVLWPFLDDGDRQIVQFVVGSARVYAIEAGTEPLMAVTRNDGTPEEDVAAWLATTDAIVSSIILE